MKIKNVNVFDLKESIIRSGYPMQTGEPPTFKYPIHITERDIKRIEKLTKVKGSTGHDNFLKGIRVSFDLQYPEYFSPQLQRYSWVDISSSQSKMHKITSKKLTIDDFTITVYPSIILEINNAIKTYNKTDNTIEKDVLFNQIISNLPSGYLKWMGISSNYLQLKTIYWQRKNHKLKEWTYFCNWIETLPMSWLITRKNK